MTGCGRCAPFGVCFCRDLYELQDAPAPEDYLDDEEEDVYIAGVSA